MAGVKDAIGSGQLNAKLLDICPGFDGEEKENCKMVYTRIVKGNEIPYDLNIEDALKKKMTPVVNVSGLVDGNSSVTTHAMVAYYLTNDSQELIELYQTSHASKPTSSTSSTSDILYIFNH